MSQTNLDEIEGLYRTGSKFGLLSPSITSVIWNLLMEVRAQESRRLELIEELTKFELDQIAKLAETAKQLLETKLRLSESEQRETFHAKEARRFYTDLESLRAKKEDDDFWASRADKIYKSLNEAHKNFGKASCWEILRDLFQTAGFSALEAPTSCPLPIASIKTDVDGSEEVTPLLQISEPIKMVAATEDDAKYGHIPSILLPFLKERCQLLFNNEDRDDGARRIGVTASQIEGIFVHPSYTTAIVEGMLRSRGAWHSFNGEYAGKSASTDPSRRLVLLYREQPKLSTQQDWTSAPPHALA